MKHSAVLIRCLR